uniref:Uncharacterized protein n=1 Tax=Arundo donax TaxID=35708 RepID=A0A0A8YS57_ARUDO
MKGSSTTFFHWPPESTKSFLYFFCLMRNSKRYANLVIKKGIRYLHDCSLEKSRRTTNYLYMNNIQFQAHLVISLYAKQMFSILS